MHILRRKIFIDHYKGNRREVDASIKMFGNVFILKVLGANNNDQRISSTNPEYVTQRIHEIYLGGSTVTSVLLGACTHSRRYVDWEIKSSLQQGKDLSNGLIGIVLPSQNNTAYLPERLKANGRPGHQGCYGRYWPYPTTEQRLWSWIEDAHQARTERAHLINNLLPMTGHNSKCEICSVTH